MTTGFCLTEQRNVEIDATARCLIDGTRTIAPSTGCVHQSWVDGAWSPCIPIEGEIQRRVCHPYPAAQWRNVFAQQEKAVAKRERARDLAARRFAPRTPSPPKMRDAHHPLASERQRAAREPMSCPVCALEFVPKWNSGKWSKTCSRPCSRTFSASGRPAMPTKTCPICSTEFKAKLRYGKRQTYCSEPCRQRGAFAGVQTLPLIPCPVCGTGFKAKVVAAGGRRQTCCSRDCANTAMRGNTRATRRSA